MADKTCQGCRYWILMRDGDDWGICMAADDHPEPMARPTSDDDRASLYTSPGFSCAMHEKP